MRRNRPAGHRVVFQSHQPGSQYEQAFVLQIIVSGAESRAHHQSESRSLVLLPPSASHRDSQASGSKFRASSAQDTAMLALAPASSYSSSHGQKANLRGERLVDSREATPAPKADQQRTVLIVEDEEAIAEALAMIVEDAGHRALVVYDGRQALAMTSEQRPDLIITDLMMPYVSGAELIRAIRGEASATGKVPPPIMLVTAASRARAEEAGADMVLLKPFNLTSVEDALSALLSSRSH